jgi:hypothetical protein
MFFKDERYHFFKPLTGKLREVIACCLRELYDSTYGSESDRMSGLSRENLKAVFLPIVQRTPLLAADGIEGSDTEDSDDQRIASEIIRILVKEGWLEQRPDPVSLQTVFCFTKPGKMFAKILSEIERPRGITRQRNMRSVKNSLVAYLSNGQDPNDLYDAYEYAERVVTDLSEDIEHFYEMVRRLVSEASQRQAWVEFLDFIDRKFQKEMAVRLVADNAERHRSDIRDRLDDIRALSGQTLQAAEYNLDFSLPTLAAARVGNSTLQWTVNRIEEMIDSACDLKLPELYSSMKSYTTRLTSLLRQVMVMQKGVSEAKLGQTITALKSLERPDQDALLLRIGATMEPAHVRLIDPHSFRLLAGSEKRKASTAITAPAITRAGRLKAFVDLAEAKAFAMSNDDILANVLAQFADKTRMQMLLSEMPLQTAKEVITVLHAVEAIRSMPKAGLVVRQLDSMFKTPYFSSNDYLIRRAA